MPYRALGRPRSASAKLTEPARRATLPGLEPDFPDHYAVLGLDRSATTAQIRAAYRVLAKRHHPDLNPDAGDSADRTQELNAAHEVLSDPARRCVYDRERDSARAPQTKGRIKRNISQDAYLRIEELLRGTSLDVAVKDPAHPGGAENYRLAVPVLTAPGARFRLSREAPFEGGFVELRVRVLPGFRFKAKGSDLRLDLRISGQRAASGGNETISGPSGSSLQIRIPAHVRRGEVLRIAGEGLPKARGGRGDLQVRIVYRPEVRISRSTTR